MTKRTMGNISYVLAVALIRNNSANVRFSAVQLATPYYVFFSTYCNKIFHLIKYTTIPFKPKQFSLFSKILLQRYLKNLIFESGETILENVFFFSDIILLVTCFIHFRGINGSYVCSTTSNRSLYLESNFSAYPFNSIIASLLHFLVSNCSSGSRQRGSSWLLQV